MRDSLGDGILAYVGKDGDPSDALHDLEPDADVPNPQGNRAPKRYVGPDWMLWLESRLYLWPLMRLHQMQTNDKMHLSQMKNVTFGKTDDIF